MLNSYFCHTQAMKKIAALIDFTEGCKIALAQAGVIARISGAELTVIYVMTEGGDKAAKEAEIAEFAGKIPGMPDTIVSMAGSGDLLTAAAQCLYKAESELVVVGTHGIHGIKQHLFGAHILKLVQAIKLPCLVVQENTRVNPEGIKSILFPVGSDPKYDMKIKQTSDVAKIFNAEIVQYEIEKSVGNETMLQRNSRDAREYFENNGFRYRSVIEEATVMSVGFSRQTLKYASENQIGLIAQLSEVPATVAYYGKADKENFLTNEFGIPILCCND